jgi:prepilin peptidase CpaA
MGWEPIAPYLIAACGIVLLFAGVQDARSRTIAHWQVIAVILLAPLYWIASGLSPWPDMAIRLAAGIGTLMLFLIPFAFGWMAGGDVKLLAALALWLPPELLLVALQVVAIVGGIVTLPFWLARRRQGDGKAPVEVPYGVAIAAGGLIMLSKPIVNQFG